MSIVPSNLPLKPVLDQYYLVAVEMGVEAA